MQLYKAHVSQEFNVFIQVLVGSHCRSFNMSLVLLLNVEIICMYYVEKLKPF